MNFFMYYGKNAHQSRGRRFSRASAGMWSHIQPERVDPKKNRQGMRMSEDELNRIIHLLRETDVAIPDIAASVGRSRSAVAHVNMVYEIRQYDGKRSTWRTNNENKTIKNNDSSVDNAADSYSVH